MFKFIVIAYRLCFALLVIAAVGWQLADQAFGPGFSYVHFFSFFTIVSNLFIAGIFLASAWAGKRGHVFVLLRGAAVVYMVITGVVYTVLLAPAAADVGIVVPWVDVVLHRIMPVVAIVDWILVPPRLRLDMQHVRLWLVFPVVFVGYALIRGHVTGWYPYPFLDPSASGGYIGVALYCAAIATGVILAGVLVMWSGNALRRYAHKRPHHYPHYRDSNTPAIAWSGTKKHWLVLILASSIVGMVGVGGWTAWQLARNARIETGRHIASADIGSMRVRTDTYQGQYFSGEARYILTGNDAVNTSIQRIVDAYFWPCRSTGMQRTYQPVYTCDAAFEIGLATDDHLVLTYTFNGSHMTEQRRGLVYDMETGERLLAADLFKEDASFAERFTETARELLQERFGEAYETHPALETLMHQATEPGASAFNNFIFTVDEELVLLYEAGVVAPNAEGVVYLQLQVDRLYDVLRPEITRAFLPELEARKQEERRRVEEARQRAVVAEVARQHTRSLVAPNRSNIDCSQMKCIALTYDDGPGAYTAQLLDILRVRGAVATFYVLGSRASPNAGLLKRMVAEHSEVANHSWSHANLTHLSNDNIASEIERTNHAIFNAIGAYPTTMRPPYGAYDARVIAHAGMPIAMWSADTNDWRDRNADIVYQRATSGARPGAVILMHDIHATTVQAAPRIIDELQRQGYVLVTMSELFGITGDNVHGLSGRVLRAR